MTEPDHSDRPDHADTLRRLARLSAALQVDPPPAGLAADVDARIRTLPVPTRRAGPWQLVADTRDRLRRHWRAATAIAVALLIGLLAVSPAGARIAQWLGIGAVQVVPDQDQASGVPDPASADGFTELTLDQARERVGFPLVRPAELGDPTRVFISPDDRVVSMVWTDGDPTAPGTPVRLDQMSGHPDFAVIKGYAGDVEFRRVDGNDAFWLRSPHPLVYTDAGGANHTERPRVAGPTLIWLSGPVTLRLEGVPDRERAIQIGQSAG